MIKYGLRSKRFRLVSEQRKTEERDFSENGTRVLAPFFARSLTAVPRFLHLNRTETPATQAR